MQSLATLHRQVAFGEANLLNVGGFYTGADGMLRLRFQGIADMIDIDFALVEPNGAALAEDFAGNAAGVAWQSAAAVLGPTQVIQRTVGTLNEVYTPAAGYQDTDTDITLPQVEARILFNLGALQLEMSGGWLEFENVAIDGTGAEREYDIDAWVVAFGIKYAMGPFSFKGNIHSGENNSYLGQWVYDDAVATYDAANDSIIDSDRWGWSAVMGFKLNDMLSFEAGYAEAEMETNVVGDFDDEVSSYYVQAVIAPTAGVLIIPEIGERDYDDDTTGADEGDTFYFGACWKISF